MEQYNHKLNFIYLHNNTTFYTEIWVTFIKRRKWTPWSRKIGQRKHCDRSINSPKKEARFRFRINWRRVMILMQPNTARIVLPKFGIFQKLFFFYKNKKIILEGRNNVRRQVEVIFKLSSRPLSLFRGGGLYMKGPSFVSYHAKNKYNFFFDGQKINIIRNIWIKCYTSKGSIMYSEMYDRVHKVKGLFVFLKTMGMIVLLPLLLNSLSSKFSTHLLFKVTKINNFSYQL